MPTSQAPSQALTPAAHAATAGRRPATSHQRSRAALAAAALGGLSLVLAACGDDESASAAGDSAEQIQVGYSAPFLSAQFEVVLQQETLRLAEDTNLKFLAPTNADMDSGQQITRLGVQRLRICAVAPRPVRS